MNKKFEDLTPDELKEVVRKMRAATPQMFEDLREATSEDIAKEIGRQFMEAICDDGAPDPTEVLRILVDDLATNTIEQKDSIVNNPEFVKAEIDRINREGA